MIVDDLLIDLQTKEAWWSYLSLSTVAFSDRPIGYKIFKPIVEVMETAGLIDVSLGRNSQAMDFGGGQKPIQAPSFSKRFRPTATMVVMALEAGIGDQAAAKHFSLQLPKKVIEVRTKGGKHKGTQGKRKETKVCSHKKEQSDGG